MKQRKIKKVGLIVAAISAVVVAGVWWRSDRPAESFHRAMVALETGSVDAVNEEVVVLKRFPEYRGHVRFLEGAVCLRIGQPEEALRRFTSEPPLDSLNFSTRLLTGEAFYRLGRLSEAESLFQELIVERPRAPQIHQWLASIYYDLGAMAEAIEHLLVVVELKPDDYRPRWLLGHLHFDFEFYELAVERLRQSLALNPPMPQRMEITAELARALVRQRDYAGAIQLLADANTSVETLVLQAEAYSAIGESEKANERLSKAEKVDGSYIGLLVVKGRMCLEDGRASAALPLLQKASELEPHDYEITYQLSQCLQRLGMKDEADAALARMENSKLLREKLTKLHYEAFSKPRDPEVRQQLADVCMQLHKPELAAMWKQAAKACLQD